ncbi:MAG: acyl carrier protein [Planctomycetota bacterium]
MASTMDRVKKVTAELLKVDIAKVTENARFVEDLGAESIQSIELVASFEEEFDIEMDEDEALSVKTVKNAADFIDKVLKG